MLTSFLKPKVETKLKHEAFFHQLRKDEFGRLDKNNEVYLDYTGGNLTAKSLLEKHFKLLAENTFGNPHSTNPSSQFATKLVEETRKKILDYFNATDYYCVFTQNASAALQIIGESYPFEDDGHYLHCIDNHNSVNGIREYCSQRGGTHQIFSVDLKSLQIDEKDLLTKLDSCTHQNKLLAFPAQSNVSGVKHPLRYIEMAKERGWDVLLDAAAFVPTNTLDLSKFHPDFVSISFYKMFGYPTGIGCLLIKKSAFEKLRKRWFAGGTVYIASSKTPFFSLVDNHERFENGTINYLGIPAVSYGLDFLSAIGMDRLNERVHSLMQYLKLEFEKLSHTNGTQQVQIFGPENRDACGGTMIVNFFNPDGSKIPFFKIEAMTNAKQISIRSGCFCNPGIDEINYDLSPESLETLYHSKQYFSFKEMREALEKMRGAIRISVGLVSNQKDLDALIDLIKTLKDRTLD